MGTSTSADCLLHVGRALATTDSIATLGPAGTSSEAAARHLWGRFAPPEVAAHPARVTLLDTYEECLDALHRGEVTTVVVANAYARVSEFYMDPDAYLWGAFVLDTPPYGIASATPSAPSGPARLATHPAPVPLIEQLLPRDTDRLEVVLSTSTSSAARAVRAGRADLALTTESAAALHQLHFVSRTRTIRMLWSVFRSVSADATAPTSVAVPRGLPRVVDGVTEVMPRPGSPRVDEQSERPLTGSRPEPTPRGAPSARSARVNRAAEAMPTSGIRDVMDAARSHPGAIRLDIGDPDFRTPPHIVAAAERAARSGLTHYAPNAGVPELREALAGKVRTRNGYDARPEHVVVTQGATQGIFAALLATTEPGDGILVPDPAWPTYPMMARLLRLDCAPYQLTEAADFLPTVDRLERLTTPRTRVLLLNSPSNPLGAVIPPDRMRDLMDFAARHDLWVVSDECYDELVFDGTFVSAAAIDPDRVISAYSFSKTYAMTGWRVGCVVVPDRAASVVAKCQEALIACVSTPTQWAAVAALTGPQDCVAEMRAAYRRRRDRARATLESHGVPAFRSSGSFFIWLDVSGSGMGDREFAVRLLTERGVAVVPGTAFGAAGAGYVRISIAAAEDDLVEGVERLATWLAELRAGRAPRRVGESRPAATQGQPGGLVECRP